MKYLELPNSLEAEHCLLGSILLTPGLIDKININSEDFYYPKNAMVYKHCRILADEGSPVDILLVADSMGKTGELDKAGGPAYLAELVDVIPAAGYASRYAKIIRDKADVRKVIKVAADVMERCCRNEDITEGISLMEEAIYSVATDVSRKDFSTFQDAMKSTLERLSKLESKGGGGGLGTGFVDFDLATAGLHPSDLVIIAARPSMGKTALAMNMALNISVNNKIPVGVFSLEMSAHQICCRAISSLTGTAATLVRHGKIKSFAELEGINAPLLIDETPSLTISEIRSKARRMKRKHDVQLIVIDYLQLVRAKAESREREISKISAGLKAMAKELDIPVIALSQLNRSLENRSDKKPMLSDLRESGSIEQDADLVCFIYRDEVYNKTGVNNHGVAELIIGKQRNGPTGTIKLYWDDLTTTFRNYVDHDRAA